MSYLVFIGVFIGIFIKVIVGDQLGDIVLGISVILGTLVFTGIRAGTGGRILEAYRRLNLNEDFLMTYGDGLSNVKISKLITFHYKKGAKVTLTAVRPKQRYGIIKINNSKVKLFDNSNKKINSCLLTPHLKVGNL